MGLVLLDMWETKDVHRDDVNSALEGQTIEMTSTSLLSDEPFTMHAIDGTIYSIKRGKSLHSVEIFVFK